MRVLLVSGIWPPDVGGPASHAPDLAEFLRGRGHEVEVVTTADMAPEDPGYPVQWVPRRRPLGVRHALVVSLVRKCAALSDVTYATSMIGRAALGSALARRPLVIKLTTDEAYERAQRRGLFAGDMDDFQRWGGGVRVTALRRTRDAALSRAARVICPSAYLCDMAVAWGVPPGRTVVIPNPAPALPPVLPSRNDARAAFGMDGPALAFAGRIGGQKALEVGLQAVAEADAVSLYVAGDGPERPAIEARAAELGLASRVRFLGPRPREDVLALFSAADATLLSSRWENFPHTIVESLAVGTPVIATSVGGVPEIVRDGENGLLVPAGDVGGLAAAVTRFFSEPGLCERLAAAAAPSVAGYAREEILSRIEGVLVEAARR